MERHFKRLYYATILFGVIISVITAVFVNNQIFNANLNNTVDDWTQMVPSTSDGSIVTYQTTIPADDITDKSLAIYLAHTELEVTVGDKLIYSVKLPDYSSIHTTGYSWNFIPMSQEYAGQPITISLRPTYASGKLHTEIYYGRTESLLHAIISDDLVSFLVSVALMIIGSILLIYALFIIGKAHTEQSLLHFAIFTILLGTWTFADSSICALVLPWSIGHVFFTHISLMLMPIPFLLFLRSTYQERSHPLWMIYCFFNCFVVILRIVLQLFNIKDFMETLRITHISILLFVVICAYLTVREVVLNKITQEMRINIICICIIMLTTMLDLIHYNLTRRSSVYGSLGFLLFTAVMGIHTLKSSHKMLERANESEIYRKLAYTDELTGLYNRTAFKRDIVNQQTVDKTTGATSIAPTVIFMFDLNDLKKCNDTYGHEYGDKYISMASSIINHVFGHEGRCYRIGGDEFCVILPFISNKDLSASLELFRRKVRECNRKRFVVPVTIAVGYAVYDPNIDQTLSDTQNRADALMYQDKIEQKKGRVS